MGKSFIALDGGGTADKWRPATVGMAVVHRKVVTQAFGMGFFPPAGANYTCGNFCGYEAEELGLAACLSEFGHHGTPEHRDGKPSEMYVEDHIIVVDSLRFADNLIDDRPLSHLTAATRKLVYSQLLQFKEVLILDRDVIPHLCHNFSKNRNGKVGRKWAPDEVGRATSLTHHMDLTVSNKLCSVKMKELLGITFLVDTTAVNKHHKWLGGAIVGVFVRGPSRQLNLGPWLRVVLTRAHELPMTRAARRYRDSLGEDPTPFFVEGEEEIVNSRRVVAENVLSCGDFWPDGMLLPLNEVTPGEGSGPPRYGRHGVI